MKPQPQILKKNMKSEPKIFLSDSHYHFFSYSVSVIPNQAILNNFSNNQLQFVSLTSINTKADI